MADLCTHITNGADLMAQIGDGTGTVQHSVHNNDSLSTVALVVSALLNEDVIGERIDGDCMNPLPCASGGPARRAAVGLAVTVLCYDEGSGLARSQTHKSGQTKGNHLTRTVSMH